MGFGSKPQIEFKLFGHIYLNTPKMNWIRNQKSEQKGDIFHMWPHKIYRRKSVKQTLEREKKKKHVEIIKAHSICIQICSTHTRCIGAYTQIMLVMCPYTLGCAFIMF